MNLQKSGGNETFVKPTTDEELRLVDEFKKHLNKIFINI